MLTNVNGTHPRPDLKDLQGILLIQTGIFGDEYSVRAGILV